MVAIAYLNRKVSARKAVERGVWGEAIFILLPNTSYRQN